jgi:hypothetical protein
LTSRRVTSVQLIQQRMRRVIDYRLHSMLARWRNRFSQLLNVHGVNDIRQTELQTAEPPVPEPSGFEVETAM